MMPLWTTSIVRHSVHSRLLKVPIINALFISHFLGEASKFGALSHMCHESGLLIGSQQVSFFRTNLLFPNLPAFLFIDKTGFLIGYKNPNLPACCLRCRPPQTAQQQWRTKFS